MSGSIWSIAPATTYPTPTGSSGGSPMMSAMTGLVAGRTPAWRGADALAMTRDEILSKARAGAPVTPDPARFR